MLPPSPHSSAQAVSGCRWRLCALLLSIWLLGNCSRANPRPVGATCLRPPWVRAAAARTRASAGGLSPGVVTAYG